MGKKILLIDADLRKPKINEYLNLKDKKGLSDFLSSDNNISEYYQRCDGYDNFICVTSGSRNIDPPKLLASEKFKELIEKLKISSEFDYIIINTTPIIGISDPLIIMPLVDQTIFVVSVQYVSKDLAYDSLKILNNYNKEDPLIISNCPNKVFSYGFENDEDYINYYID